MMPNMLSLRLCVVFLLAASQIQPCAAGPISSRNNWWNGRSQGFDSILRTDGTPGDIFKPTKRKVATKPDLETACAQAISVLGTSRNDAGLVACYDVSDFEPQTGDFRSEVLMYQQRKALSGSFAGVKSGDLVFTIDYPAAGVSQVTKRIKRQQSTSSSAPEVLFNHVYQGQLTRNLQLSKLNQTETIALLIPSITVTASSATISMTSADIAFFPVGVFSQTQHSSLDAALSNASRLASAAIAAASIFVLPGTTLGIFPTGLIVTGVWCVLFLAAFGYGTVGRIRHQKQFRRRIANPRFGSR